MQQCSCSMMNSLFHFVWPCVCTFKQAQTQGHNMRTYAQTCWQLKVARISLFCWGLESTAATCRVVSDSAAGLSPCFFTC